MKEHLKTLVAAMLLFSVVAGLGAAATETDSTPTLADKTMAVDNDTRSVYAEITNVSDGNATVEVYGVDEDGFSTEVHNETVSPGANETVMVEQSVNSTKYDEYRVMVKGTTSNTSAEEITIGTLMEVAGGSGGLLDGDTGSLGIGALAVVAAGVLFLRD